MANEQKDFFEIKIPRSKVEEIATSKGYESVETALEDTNFISHLEKFDFEKGRQAASGEFNKTFKQLATDLGMTIETDKNLKGSEVLDFYRKEYDAIKEKYLKSEKAKGADSKELTVMRKEFEEQVKEEIAKIKNEYEGKVTELSTREKELLGQVEELKGKEYDREVMQLIADNIPNDGSAEKNPLALSKTEKQGFKYFIKEHLDISQRSDGTNMFTKKGTENALKVRLNGVDVTLKTDGSNFRDFFAAWCKENECFRVAPKVVPQNFEKPAQPNGGGVAKTLEDKLEEGLKAAQYKVK